MKRVTGADPSCSYKEVQENWNSSEIFREYATYMEVKHLSPRCVYQLAGRSATSLPKQQPICSDGWVSMNGNSSWYCTKGSAVGIQCMNSRTVLFVVVKKDLDLILTSHFTANVLLWVLVCRYLILGNVICKCGCRHRQLKQQLQPRLPLLLVTSQDHTQLVALPQPSVSGVACLFIHGLPLYFHVFECDYRQCLDL